MCRSPVHRYLFDFVCALLIVAGVLVLQLIPLEGNAFRCPEVNQRCYFCNEVNRSNVSWASANCNITWNFELNQTKIDACCCGVSKATATTMACPAWSTQITGMQRLAFYLMAVGVASLFVMSFFEMWFFLGCIPGAEGRPDVRRRARELRLRLDAKNQ